MRRQIAFALIFFGLLSPTAVMGAPPDIQTKAPVIYLADNLDEADNLGWCIDTIGRGFSDRIHAHSCKPQGGDVQFSLNTKTGQIMSVAFAGKCVVVLEPVDQSVSFGLLDCQADEVSQQFRYDPARLYIEWSGDPSQCVSVGAASRAAGPFMSRDLILSDCATTDPASGQWIIRP